MTDKESESVEVTKQYYDSSDADNFYFTIWGGEDLHLGIYEYPEEPIFDASRRTIDRMCSKVEGRITPSTRILDLGAGFGGTARYLAGKYGCHVTAQNLSEVENERDRKMNKEQGLDHLVDVVDGNFEELPFQDESYDLVWSQDSILHSGKREQVIKEAARVLKPGGDLVFTDPMQADDCPEGVLDAIYERIHLTSLGSPAVYRKAGKEAGLKEMSFEELTPHLTQHYARVLQETEKNEERLREVCSDEYIQRMKKGLANWVDGGKKGYLCWGIFHFHKE
ncbi:MAG: methyltransferase domain-containing protein [bacterium]